MVIKDKNQSGTWQTKTYYFWTNQRGDVTSIVDNKGTEVGFYTYDAFGNVLSESGTIAKENSIRYASYYYDQETKHYYLKARYYDPQNGNFLALNPHPGDEDDPISQNGYMYAGNNPVLQVDPDGDFFWLTVNVGFAAYDGYKAYRAGGSAAKIAGAAALGLAGGSRYKAAKKVVSIAYQRRSAVKKDWAAERAMIARTGKGTRNWSNKRKQQILEKSKAKGFMDIISIV
ncbi:MAG: RHS repeat-associated core domain-containing protein [Bacillus sp. (in: firmicutes)]